MSVEESDLGTPAALSAAPTIPAVLIPRPMADGHWLLLDGIRIPERNLPLSGYFLTVWYHYSHHPFGISRLP